MFCVEVEAFPGKDANTQQGCEDACLWILWHWSKHNCNSCTCIIFSSPSICPTMALIGRQVRITASNQPKASLDCQWTANNMLHFLLLIFTVCCSLCCPHTRCTHTLHTDLQVRVLHTTVVVFITNCLTRLNHSYKKTLWSSQSSHLHVVLINFSISYYS